MWRAKSGRNKPYNAFELFLLTAYQGPSAW